VANFFLISSRTLESIRGAEPMLRIAALANEATPHSELFGANSVRNQFNNKELKSTKFTFLTVSLTFFTEYKVCFFVFLNLRIFLFMACFIEHIEFHTYLIILIYRKQSKLKKNLTQKEKRFSEITSESCKTLLYPF
jgi:hypothetical protein